MKPLYLTLALTTLLFACKKEEKCSSGNQKLRLDFQSMYVQDTVQIFLDGTAYNLDSAITTQNHVGVALAAIKEFSVSGCNRTVKIVINGRHQADTSFYQDTELYMGIDYNQGKIGFKMSKEPFLYL